MAIKVEKILKKYNSYSTPTRCGLHCHIHEIAGEHPLHRHDYIEIEYIVKGKIEHEINGIKSVATVGDCYCLYPHDLHRFRVIEPVVIHNICIDYMSTPLPIRKILSEIASPLVGKVEAQSLNQLISWFEELMSLLSSNEPFTEEKIIAYTLLVISRIFENSTTEKQKPIRNYYYVSRAMDYIAEHYSEDINIGQAAGELYLSVGHLSKLFTKINGISFSDYLTLFRIEKARSALSETNKSITEISFESGFNSFPTFSRSFKKLCGCTPSEYRSNFTKSSG